MSAPMKWLIFFSTIVLAGAAVVVVWTGDFSEGLVKALASFIVLAGATFALHALGRGRRQG